MAFPIAITARRVTHELRGVVVSAGLMQRTVKVRVAGLKWNKIVKKHFSDPKTYFVHDSNSSLRTGDVVAIAPGWPTSRHKRHFVKHIIAPFGEPIESRPPVKSLEQLISEYERLKNKKDERRALRKKKELKTLEEQKNAARTKTKTKTKKQRKSRPKSAAESSIAQSAPESSAIDQSAPDSAIGQVK